MSVSRCLRLLAVALLCTPVLFADNPIDDIVLSKTVKQKFARELEQNQKLHKGNKDMFVRNGIVADRKKREVKVKAVACGLAKGAPTEFLLVGEGGKDYESLSATFARASDITAAMKFIGMQPGRPTDRRVFQFWPKGERVRITFHFQQDGKTVNVRAEDLVLDNTKNKTLPREDWIFAGSTMGEFEGKKIFLADNTGDIIADFNSPWTVFDVPYRAEQGAVYGSLVPNPKYLMKMHQELVISITPVLPPGQTRVVDYTVTVGGQDGKPPAAANDIRLTVRDGAGKEVLNAGDFKAFLNVLLQGMKQKKDIFTRLQFADNMPTRALLEFAPLIQELVNKKVIRIEADEKQLFYEAFLPQAGWRNPKKRVIQPIELHLHDDGTRHIFQYYDEEYLQSGDVKLKKNAYQFLGSAELMKIIRTRKQWDTSTVLFFCAPKVPYRLIRKFYLENAKLLPVAYVFEATAK